VVERKRERTHLKLTLTPRPHATLPPACVSLSSKPHTPPPRPAPPRRMWDDAATRTHAQPLFLPPFLPPSLSPPPQPPPPTHTHAHSFTTLLPLPSAGTSVRRMGPSAWATAVSPPGTTLEDARSSSFGVLFGYIAKNGYEMTAPVLTRVAGDGSVRVSFLLPASVGAPADGSAQGVVVESLPAQTFAVKPFKGAASAPSTWEGLATAARALTAEAASAQLALAAPVPAEQPEQNGKAASAGTVVGPGVWYAGYSSPMTPPGAKYSEVWLPVAEGAVIPGVAP